MNKQDNQPQIAPERMEVLKELLGKEVFCIAYTLDGDGTIEVMTVINCVANEAGPPIVVLAGRSWRTHQMGVDTFLSLTEAVDAANLMRTTKISDLRAQADNLVALQLRAPSHKVKEIEEQQRQQQAEAQAAPALAAAPVPKKVTQKSRAPAKRSAK